MKKVSEKTQKIIFWTIFGLGLAFIIGCGVYGLLTVDQY